ncbi:mechanosensitive ion channel domain-containing protein [Marinicella rhabdoformis]|uniref:mechanosensitive ion channel domain-containing protein n=1 Tax=Marinicella rhabdoformis TaxID=2580566 RepID=UPI001C55681B|nr:mechanosensitive ion channel domain-containing protein [Marinicella rhabdoformis]
MAKHITSHSIQVLLVFIMAASCHSVMAQSPLDLITTEKQAEQYTPPDVNKLTSNWWQSAIQSAPKDQPYLYLNNWGQSLFSELKQTPNSFSLEDSQAITQFYTNIQELQKRAQQKPKPPSISLENKPPHTLTQIYERLKELRQLKQLLLNHKEAEDDFISEGSQNRERIDRLVIEYGALAVNDTERVSIGLLWMAYRSWLALNQLQAQQANDFKQATEKNIQALEKHINQIKSGLKPNMDSIDGLERQIQINLTALEQNQKTVLQGNLAFAQSQKNASFSGLETDINRLDLVQDIMSQRRLELALARDRTHITWIEFNLSDDNEKTKAINARIEENQTLIENTNKQLTQWQLLAQQMLLSPAAHLLSDDDEKQAFAKRTNMAQNVLLDLDEIYWQKDKVTFLQSLLTETKMGTQSGFSLWWSELKNLSTSTFSTVSEIINKPLFRINDTPITLRPLLQIPVIILIGFILSKLVRVFLNRIESRKDSDDAPLFFMLNKIIHYIIVIAIVLACFTTLGINLSNLTLIAGALSVGIGFGLQNIVSNFVSGLTIMFERSLKVGDYIELESGITGSVKEINARSTRINTNDNIDVVIPNSDLVTNQIINWTLRDSIKRVKIPFGVAYGTDKDLVRKAAIEAAEKVPFTLTNMKGKEPEVWMKGFGDNSLDFILLVWVSKYGVRRPNRIKASFLWELDNAFNKYEIEVPFPQRVLHHPKDKAQGDKSEDQNEDKATLVKGD